MVTGVPAPGAPSQHHLPITTSAEFLPDSGPSVLRLFDWWRWDVVVECAHCTRGWRVWVVAKEVTVPLSDHEQKLLEQMERALYAEDPKFATQMKGSASRGTARHRLIVGIIIALLGLVLVVVGVTTEIILLGGAGFGVMVVGVAWALTPPRRAQDATAQGSAAAGKGASSASATSTTKTTRGARSAKKPRGRSFLQRMEERWEQRRRNGQF